MLGNKCLNGVNRKPSKSSEISNDFKFNHPPTIHKETADKNVKREIEVTVPVTDKLGQFFAVDQ